MKWPRGIRSGVASCGIKPDALDLGVLVSEAPAVWAGAFTRNAAAAAPVRWSRSLLGTPIRAIVVNSGNANACTGPAGEQAVRATAAAAASALGCAERQVCIASTGPIGVQLPVDLVTTGVGSSIQSLTTDALAFARAIMTTDTREKTAAIACGPARVVGVAKGAAMIAPNMATMLAFVATDAGVDASWLRATTTAAADKTFNRVSIDGCESTNDSVFVLATGRELVPGERLRAAIDEVCADLARQIAADAEGSTKTIRIEIDGASDSTAAVSYGKAIAGSALWRAAANGEDPNWGRIVSALGAADPSLQLDELQVWIGAEQVFGAGRPTTSLEGAVKQMQGDVIDVSCRVGSGPGRAEVLSADLSTDYVILNSTGST